MDELDAVLSGVPPATPARRSASPPAPRPASPRPAPSAPAVSPEVGEARTADLHSFVTSSGLELSPGRSGYATSGHNPGSLHGEGYAVDVRVRDRKPEEVDDFISKAKGAGYVVRDERTRPAGQSVWDGPHVHLEYDELGKVLADIPAQAPKDELDAVLSGVPDAEEVISTEAAIEGSTGKALSLTDPRRKQRPDASTVQLSPPPKTFLTPPGPESFDVRTMEGRQARDAQRALARTPGARFDVTIPVSHVEDADAAESLRDYYKSAAAAEGVPVEYFDKWQRENNPQGYYVHDGRGNELTAADVYDDGAKGLRLSVDANHLAKIVDDYKASRGTLTKLSDWATSDDASAGEKFLDVAGTVAAPVVKGAGYVARPFSAASAGVWAATRGENPLREAGHVLTTGETTAAGENPVGNYLRDSTVLNRINPRLGALLGGGADVLLDPANLLALGVVGKGAKLLAGAGRVGRAAEEVNALGRSLGLLERGLVESRPLGIEAATVEKGGELASLEDRLSRVLEVTRKLKAGEALTPEEAALHAEVRAAAEAAPSAAVRGEMLKYAEQRAAYYKQVARRAKSAGERNAARELADDYAREVGQLRRGPVGPSAEGYDVADAHHSKFQPRTEVGQFDGPPAPRWKRALRGASDVAQLPKAKAGYDLSATGRQGLPQVLAHPTYLKEAFAEQVKAFASEDAFNEFIGSITSRPDFPQMQKAGLDLSHVGGLYEEPFASRLARKIPGVRASDRAYSAAMDSIRTQAWDNYTASLPAHLRDNEKTLKAVAELINISTGRGRVPILDRYERGRKFVDALNVVGFSPRNTASKFNLISPARLVKNMASAETRPVAWLQMRDAMRGGATFATTLGLAHLAGLDVGLDPREKNFGKLRVGNAVYDLTGGEGYTAQYLASMARAFYDVENGKRLKPRETPSALTLRYLRSQLQPAAAVGVDLATGKTFDGEKATKLRATADLVAPFVLADMYKGWVDTGGSTLTDVYEGKDVKTAFGGAARALPGVVGVGTNFYPKRGRRGGPDEGVPDEPGELVTPETDSGGVQSNYLRLEGKRESPNVEYARSPRWTDEDSAALSEEVASSGASRVTDGQVAAAARILDSLDNETFGAFARDLDEHFNSGVLRPLESAATYATEYGAEGLARLRPSRGGDYRKLAGAARVLRLLAEERAARPVQFVRDALAGKYGEKMRAEAEEAISYPENRFPWDK